MLRLKFFFSLSFCVEVSFIPQFNFIYYLQVEIQANFDISAGITTRYNEFYKFYLQFQYIHCTYTPNLKHTFCLKILQQFQSNDFIQCLQHSQYNSHIKLIALINALKPADLSFQFHFRLLKLLWRNGTSFPVNSSNTFICSGPSFSSSPLNPAIKINIFAKFDSFNCKIYKVTSL